MNGRNGPETDRRLDELTSRLDAAAARILDLENQVLALRARNAELGRRVNELTSALEAALATLHERRPNLPALRPRGTIHPFGG